MRPHGNCGAATLALIVAGILATGARADKAECEYKDIDVAKYGEKPFQNPPEVVSQNGVLTTQFGYCDALCYRDYSATPKRTT